MLRRRAAAASDTPLSDALLTIAASLSDSSSADDALNRLTRGLAEHDVGCALFLQVEGGPDLELERATLPLAPDVWGRPLRLPRLAATLARGRPALYDDIDDVLTEAVASGPARSLLSGPASGALLVAPLRFSRGRGGVLCLAGPVSEPDAPAAWGLAIQVSAALRRRGGNGAVPAPEGATGEVTLFHDLTRRLSYSLSDVDILRAGLEALAPAADFQLGATIVCEGASDVATVYAPFDPPAGVASAAAAGALDAFLRLTGDRHRACERPALTTERLATGRASAPPDERAKSTLDAPLVVDGEVRGLLRIIASAADAFGAEAERAFYTVANQLSLALERSAARRTAERAQLTSLAESLADGIVLADASLHVTSLNQAARGQLQTLLERPYELGDSLAETVIGELVEEALSAKGPTQNEEMIADDGTTRRHVMGMAAPLAGSPEGSAAVVVLRDITEERLMQERLLQSEKMVSVGQLVSGVAHELNNPLTGIMGFAQLLLARELDESTQRDVETIYAEAERAAKIVQNLLSFARRKRAEKELANLNVLLERVLELRNYDLRVKNINVQLDLDSRLPETMVDANQIQQVFLNVIINAEQAMLAAGGEGTLRVRSRAQDGSIVVSFQDDGPGMEAETLRRIFDPFFTTKEAGEGTGLGLTISYGIIDEHGGRIWAESRPGRGTTFFIELPVVKGAGTPAAPVTEPEPAVTGRSILVVDDEDSIQRLLGSILQMDGHHVDTAANGSEALQRINRRRYDLVITDIKMPDMDGRALYQRLREIDPRLAERTVFITGDTVSPDTRTFLEQVDNPCLAKPFRVREVRETIGRMMEDR